MACQLPTRFFHGSWHDDVIKWKHFPRYCQFVRGIHRSSVNSPHKGQWRGALMFSLVCGWINAWVNNHEAGDLTHNCAHYDVIVMGGATRGMWNSLATGLNCEHFFFLKWHRQVYSNSMCCQTFYHEFHFYGFFSCSFVWFHFKR